MQYSYGENLEQIWSLHIPPRVKTFIWKVAQDIIATEVSLVNHHVPCNSRCTLCGYFWADTTHALFFCQVVKKKPGITRSGGHTSDNLGGSTARELLQVIATSSNQSELEMFCTKLWGLWKDSVT